MSNAVTRRAALGLCIVAGAVWSAPVFAELDAGTADEAKAMADRAAQLVREKGVDGAIPDFEKHPGPFWDRDLYVFIFGLDGTALFNANTPALNGKKLIDLKDASGFPMVRTFIALKEPGWVEYQWADPITKKIRVKQSYIVPVANVVLGVGVYKRS